ncbi:DUF4238 domain-containing protein [Sorangium sp. So ce136]|uniref:DUF4238 domain-containing protein n=1 Tax=Sorangium sp. So ce136 TaxID=3133284 RepID=UPI003EFDEF5E
MPLHHYLPATYLAGFSSDQETLPRRDRQLVAGDRRRKRSFSAPASRLGAENDLYSLKGSGTDGQVVDRTWSEFEKSLSPAIANLISGTVTALEWVRVLVPFVASTLVRGPDFNRRFEARFPVLHKGTDNTNQARLFELQRLLGLVTAARWTILRVPAADEVIVGDVGFAPARSAVTGDLGIAIPLDCRHILLIEPQQTRHILTLADEGWRPVLNFAELAPGEHLAFSRAIAAYARRFVFGSSQEVVERYLSDPSETAPEVPEPWAFGFVTPRIARYHELTWHRLVGFVERARPEPGEEPFKLDWEALARGWCPPVFLATNLPEFAPALAFIGPDVVVHFFGISDQVLDAMMNAVAAALKKNAGEEQST